jgi:putative transposon-encoded protein
MKIEISKGNESIDAEEILKKRVTKFSNVAHLILPSKLIDREVVVVVPKVPTTKVFTAPAKQKKDGTWKINKLKELKP